MGSKNSVSMFSALDYQNNQHPLVDYVSKEDALKIQQFVDDTINGMPYNKVLVFYGTGNNGKSTVVNGIIARLNEYKKSFSQIQSTTLNDDSPSILSHNLVIISDPDEDSLKQNSTMVDLIFKRQELLFPRILQEPITISPKCNILLTTNNMSGLDVFNKDILEIINFQKIFNQVR